MNIIVINIGKFSTGEYYYKDGAQLGKIDYIRSNSFENVKRLPFYELSYS